MNLDNILMHQKDGIVELVNVCQYGKAIMLLETLQELWEECNYGYKLREIVKRIDFELWNSGGDHWKVKKKMDDQRKLLKEKFPTYFAA